MVLAPRALRALVVLTFASIVSLGAAGPAHAATTSKPYSVSVSPLALPAGASWRAVDVLVTNDANPQAIQSIKVEAPDGVELVGADGGAAIDTEKDSALWLNQYIPPGSPPTNQATYRLYVDVQCAGDPGVWKVTPKQSNDFRGPPGNTFGPLDGASDLNATLQGTCRLSWTAPPADAGIDSPITTTDFDPAGLAPAVTLLDGANQGIGGKAVTVTRGASAGTGTLAPTTTTVTTSSAAGSVGIAEFPGLEISDGGYYRLRAATAGLTKDSEAFLIQTFTRDCLDPDDPLGCVGEIPRLSVRVDPFSYGAGVLSLSMLGASPVRPDCQDYTEFGTEFAVVLGPPNGPKTIRQMIPKAQMNASPNNGASTINVCYGDLAPSGPAPEDYLEQLRALDEDEQPLYPAGASVPTSGWWFPAITVAAQTTPQAWDFDGDTVPDGIIWVLADCRTTGGARPCEDAATKDRAGNGVVTYLAPSSLLDPYGRG